jgi:hypothetical protein
LGLKHLAGRGSPNTRRNSKARYGSDGSVAKRRKSWKAFWES